MTEEREIFQADVKVVRSDGCENSGLHVDFDGRVDGGFGEYYETEVDVTFVAYDAWMESAADFAAAILHKDYKTNLEISRIQIYLNHHDSSTKR